MQVTHVMPFGERPMAAVFSGAERHLFTLMAAQRARGLDVELVMITVQPGPELADQAARLREQGISVIQVPAKCWRSFGPLPRLNHWRLIADLRRVLRSRRERVIHTHLELADWAGKTAARLAGCRHVLSSVHNDEPFFARLAWRIRFHLLDRITRRYIAISQAVKDHLVHAVGLPAEKIEVVPYGLPPPAPERSRNELRRELGLPPDQFTVGFVGRLEPQKNLPILVDAMALCPELLCVVIGAGQCREELEDRARQRQARNIRFLGFRENGAELMRGLDLLCLPSRWEGLGLVLLEAMLRGVPVMGSTAGAIPEILGHGRFGLLFRDRDSLVAQLRHATGDPAGLARLAREAQTHAMTTYTVEAMTERTMAVYARVLAMP